MTKTQRAMTHDESVYPEPFAFKPERFFDENGMINDNLNDRILAYGFGRRWLPFFYHLNSFSQSHRICVGKHVASSFVGTHPIFRAPELTPSEQLWLTFTSILATFNIVKMKDSSGKDVPINDEFEDRGFTK